MRCDTATGSVAFVCSICLTTIPGTAADARIGGEEYTSAKVHDLLKHVIANAPHDPTAQVVEIPCRACGLPYQAQLLLGDDMICVLSCKCGNVVDYRDAARA